MTQEDCFEIIKTNDFTHQVVALLNECDAYDVDSGLPYHIIWVKDDNIVFNLKNGEFKYSAEFINDHLPNVNSFLFRKAIKSQYGNISVTATNFVPWHMFYKRYWKQTQKR